MRLVARGPPEERARRIEEPEACSLRVERRRLGKAREAGPGARAGAAAAPRARVRAGHAGPRDRPRRRSREATAPRASTRALRPPPSSDRRARARRASRAARGQLLREPALPDPGLAGDEDHAAAACERAVERGLELRPLPRRARRTSPMCRARAWPGSAPGARALARARSAGAPGARDRARSRAPRRAPGAPRRRSPARRPGGRRGRAPASAARAGARAAGAPRPATSSSPTSSASSPRSRSAAMRSSSASSRSLLQPRDLGLAEASRRPGRRTAGRARARGPRRTRTRPCAGSPPRSASRPAATPASKRWTSSCPGSIWSTYRAGCVIERVARRAPCEAARPPPAAPSRPSARSPSHSSSIRRSLETTSLACSSSMPSSARCLDSAEATGRSSRRTSRGRGCGTPWRVVIGR